MDSIFTIILANWPVIIAVLSTIIVIWIFLKKNEKKGSAVLNSLIINKVFKDSNLKLEKFFRNEIEVEDLRRINEDLNYINDLANDLDGIVDFNISKDDLESLKKIDIKYDKNELRLSHIISIAWILTWIGFSSFIIIRMCFYPYYINDGILIAWFIYYIFLGILILFRD